MEKVASIRVQPAHGDDPLPYPDEVEYEEQLRAAASVLIDHVDALNFEHAPQIEETGKNRALACLTKAWLASRGIEMLNVSGNNNNCLIRCVVAAMSGGQTVGGQFLVDEQKVVELAGKARDPGDQDSLLETDGAAGKKLLDAVNSQQSDEQKKFAWVNVQPGATGPILTDEAPAGTPINSNEIIPIIVYCDSETKHYQLLVSNDRARENSFSIIQNRINAIQGELKMLDAPFEADFEKPPEFDDERNKEREALQTELGLLEKPPSDWLYA